MKSCILLAVDVQKEFSAKGGKCYVPRPCVKFIKNTLVPFLQQSAVKTAQIISDYRQPRPGDRRDCCDPFTKGYESEIPKKVTSGPVWIKSMNSPVWVRKNGGLKKKPGLPYQDPKSFIQWLHKTLGKPKSKIPIIIYGLTLDCCVLCTAQELSWQGYEVRILSEATDTASGRRDEKTRILHHPPLTKWAKSISWAEAKKLIQTTN